MDGKLPDLFDADHNAVSLHGFQQRFQNEHV
jgi:hypothetical protein